MTPGLKRALICAIIIALVALVALGLYIEIKGQLAAARFPAPPVYEALRRLHPPVLGL